MNKLDPESLAVIIVLGVLGGCAIFQPIPQGNIQFVIAIGAGLTGWLAKTAKDAIFPPQEPPAPPARRFPPDDLDIPPPPAA